MNHQPALLSLTQALPQFHARTWPQESRRSCSSGARSSSRSHTTASSSDAPSARSTYARWVSGCCSLRRSNCWPSRSLCSKRCVWCCVRKLRSPKGRRKDKHRRKRDSAVLLSPCVLATRKSISGTVYAAYAVVAAWRAASRLARTRATTALMRARSSRKGGELRPRIVRT